MHGLNHEKLLHAAVGVNVEVPETPVRKPAVPQLEGESGGGDGEGGGGEGEGEGGGGAGQVETVPETPSVRVVGQEQTQHQSEKTFGPWVGSREREITTEVTKSKAAHGAMGNFERVHAHSKLYSRRSKKTLS